MERGDRQYLESKVSAPSSPAAKVPTLPGLAPRILAGRVRTAAEKYRERVSKALSELQDGAAPTDPLALWQGAGAYALDIAVRSIALGTQGRSARRPSGVLGGRVCARDGRVVPLVHPPRRRRGAAED